MYLGLKRYLEENGYAGYTVHFEEFGADGRFEHLPFLAASSLMADGYGYAAEGDATAAMLMAAMLRLCGQGRFQRDVYDGFCAGGHPAVPRGRGQLGHVPQGQKAFPDGPGIQ